MLEKTFNCNNCVKGKVCRYRNMKAIEEALRDDTYNHKDVLHIVVHCLEYAVDNTEKL